MELVQVPCSAAAFAAGLVVPTAFVVAPLVALQAAAGGRLLGEALAAGALTPAMTLLAALVMVTMLGVPAIRAWRGVQLAVHFR